MNKYKIDTLNDDVINEIKSSLIIKKTSYILKELLENSCDANSKNISVYVENNGLNLIKIIDDGDGIDKDDLYKCGLKYTTSKIKYASDLKNLDTYGFKGESLYLIKAISQIIITSKTNKQKYAYKIYINNNHYIIEECAGNNGTEVLIKNLKTNNIVRLNENIFIPQKIIALTNFDVHFKFYKDLKEIKNLPPCYDTYSIAKRIENLIGEKYLANSINIYHESNGITLNGFISENIKKKYNENDSYLFLNKRHIENNDINTFIKNSLIKKTKKNLNYFLYLNVNPEYIYISKSYEITKTYFNNVKKILSVITDSLNKYSKNIFFKKLFHNNHVPLKLNNNICYMTNKNISDDMLYKPNNKILTILENKSIFFELNKKVYITNLINLRSKIIIEESIKQITKFGKLNSRSLQETKFIKLENKEKINIYKNILLKYGLNLEIFFNEKIIIQSIPEIIFNLPINLDNLILDTIKFLDKNISTFFSINRFDINIIKVFIDNTDIDNNCFNFELDNFYKEIINCYNNNESWFKKHCFEVSCKKALNSFKI
ncbi:MAG TPA: DNA mismatch repair endonuclease MutL [Candidatus Azoamicus sp. MARI]